MKIELTEEEFNLRCEELWRTVAVAYVNSSNSLNKEEAAKWANKIVEDYQKTFSWNPEK